jgi:DNA-directed RNA polymerase subunit RPC12/RpoP
MPAVRMTIEFRCPTCSQLCAFRERHAGRRARCLKCGQRFIIPAAGEKVQTVKPDEREEGPIGGFYRALGKLPLDIESLTGALFLLMLAFGFFLVRHMNFSMSFYVPMTGKTITILLPFGLIVSALLLGMILHYDMLILHNTAFELDSLPEERLENIFHFIALCIRGLYLSSLCVLAAGLPTLLTWLALRRLDIDAKWPLVPIGAAGLLLLPAVTATVAMSGDLLCVVRPDLYYRPIVKAFGPYLLTCLIFIPSVAALAFFYTKGLYWKHGLWINLLYLGGHLAAVLFSAYAARVAGLFCRHYYCYFL